MVGKDFVVRLAELVEQLGGSFDVGEEKGRRSAGQLAHRDPPPVASASDRSDSSILSATSSRSPPTSPGVPSIGSQCYGPDHHHPAAGSITGPRCGPAAPRSKLDARSSQLAGDGGGIDAERSPDRSQGASGSISPRGVRHIGSAQLPYVHASGNATLLEMSGRRPPMNFELPRHLVQGAAGAVARHQPVDLLVLQTALDWPALERQGRRTHAWPRASLGRQRGSFQDLKAVLQGPLVVETTTSFYPPVLGLRG